MKKNEKRKSFSVPAIPELESELRRTRKISSRLKTTKVTLYILLTVAAIAVLVAILFLPVLQIYGHSMTPSLEDGNIVVSVKSIDLEQGDIVAFYYNNKILVKRIIAGSGDWVNIKENGDVYVNQELIDEPYVKEKALGDCNIELPYQVPEGKVFVMGDHRLTSVDSRNSDIGCISEDQIVGKIIFRLWPIDQVGALN